MDEQTVLNLKKLLTESTHVEAMLQEEGGGRLSLESGLLDVLTIRALQRHLNRELKERSKLMGTTASQTEEDGRWTLNLAETLREYLATHNQISSSKRSSKKMTSKKRRGIHEKKKEHEFDTDFEEEEEKSEMSLLSATSYLSSENISFVKHGRRGRPKPRAFWLDDTDSDSWYIRWCELGQRRTRKSKRCVCIDDIVDIQNGRRTDVFSRSKGGNSDSSFSIITKERTVDLEAETKVLRDRWTRALRVVLKIKGILNH